MNKPLAYASRTSRLAGPGGGWGKTWKRCAVLASLGIAFLIAGCHHESTEHPIVNISELIHWNLHPKSTRRPVKLPAVITYYDPALHVVYLQDQTGGVCLDTGQRAFSLRAGDGVEVSGSATGAGTKTALRLDDLAFNPYHIDMPLPVDLKVREAADDVLPSTWVKVRGTVRYVGTQDGHLILHLASSGDEIDVIVGEHATDLSNLVDSLVEATGVDAPVPNFDPARPHAQLLVAYPEFISKQSSGLNPWSLPVQPIREVKKLDPRSFQTRVRVQGVFVHAANNGDWIVTNPDGQEIRVQTTGQNAPEGNRTVDVAGYLGSSDGALALLDSVVRAGDNSGNKGPDQILSTIAQVRSMTPVQAARALPVHLKEATITYFDPSWQLMFVQDATGGSYVEIQNEHQPLQAGDVVSLDGVSSPGAFAPDIAQPVIHFVRKGALPKPDLPITDDFLQGREDSRWVKVAGVIRSIDVHADRTFFHFAHNGAEIQVQVPVPAAFADPESLIDSEVEIEGVTGSYTNQKMQLTGLSMFIPTAAYVKVLKKSERDPFAIPVSTYDSLLHSSESFSGHRIHMQGIVTLQVAGNGGALYVKEKSGNIAVHLSKPAKFQPGDKVDVVGFLSTEDERPMLVEAVVRKNGATADITPAMVTPEQILKGDDEADLVAIQGTMLSKTGSADEKVLVLQSGNQIFNASLATPDNKDPFANIDDRSFVKLTGVVNMQMDKSTIPFTAKTFRILLRGPEDVVVLKSAPWWTLKHTIITVSTLGGIIIGVALWVMVLRKRVRQQTDALRQQMVKEAALEQQYKELFENASDIICTNDLDGNFTSINQAGERITGYKREQMLKMNLRSLLTSASLEKIHLDPAKLGTEEICELELIAKDGHLVPIEASRRPLWRDGQAIGTQTIAREITERKRAEAALLKAKSAAEDANRAKSSFLANMSHEIRTPLNGIIGMTELALDTELTPEQQEFLTTAKDSADSLLALINDILDFSKIEAGRLELDVISFDLRELVEETTRGLAIRAHQKKLELSHDIDATLPEYVMGDPLRLRQILTNLIANALKFTHVGEVVVQVTPAKSDGDQTTLHFSVRDTGIGIALEKQSLIFDAFSQADVSTTRQYGGTGLGLAITSKLVNIMNGSIWLESELGKGSTFHITVPLKAVESPHVAEAEAEGTALAGTSVLIIDDNATNRRILAQTLKNWKMSPTSVDSGKAALQELEAAKTRGKPYSLILLDCRMPEMDGFAVTEHIREHSGLFDGTIMMLTSDDYASNVQRCRELGISAHLMKPVKQSELLHAVADVLKVPDDLTGIADHLQGASPSRSAALKVLVAEDNLVNQRLALRLLGKHGHNVTIANNGKEAVELLRQQPFDLILMDVQMPEMDGFTATEVIRRGEQGSSKHIPIVAMTAHAMKGDRERCLAAGMDGYLSKPINSEELFRVMSAVTAGKELVGVNQDASESNAFLVVDEKSLWERLGDDSGLLAELIETFERQLPSTMAEIRGAVAMGNTGALAQAAHALKGCAANLSAEHTKSLAQQLEQLGRQGKLDGVANLVSQLEIELTNLRSALRELLRKSKQPAGSDPGPKGAVGGGGRVKESGGRKSTAASADASADGRPAQAHAAAAGTKSPLAQSTEKAQAKTVVACAPHNAAGAQNVIDPDELWNIVHGDMKLLREMVVLFERDCPPLLTQLQRELAAKNLAAAQSSLHALKGTLMAFSAGAALGAAGKLEALLKANDMVKASHGVSELETEIERLRPVLKAMTYEDRHGEKE